MPGSRHEVGTDTYELAGHAGVMRSAAPIKDELLGYLYRLAKDRKLSAAEITRRVGDRAQALGGPRPSYAGVRLLVRDVRVYPEEPSWAELLWNVAWRVDHPGVLEDKHVGLIHKNKPEDWGLERRAR
jgi:hypothetical protein